MRISVFNFIVLNYFRLFKYLENSRRNKYFGFKESPAFIYYHDNICKNCIYCYMLDMIYYSF